MENIATASDYFTANMDDVRRRWNARSDADWSEAGLVEAIRVFRAAAARVPAYKDFLARHRVDPAAIRDAAGYAAVPPTGKSNYVEHYPLTDLMWDGDPGRAAVIHASSGTTGAPQYWPCDTAEVARSGALYELILARGLGAANGRTLLVVCFGMGTWVAGAYTTAAAHLVRQKGLSVSLVTPGFNKGEALGLLAKLGPLYNQIVVAGIPSFVKDLLEAWRRDGGAGRVKLFLAGEGFPEEWRDYVATLIGGSPDDIVSILGSADAGLIGFETPRSIDLRRRAAANPEVRAALFPGEGLPAILNYVPTHRYYEAVDGRLLLTADRALPLIRYDTQDRGGVVPAGRFALDAPPGWAADTLPYVYLFGRGRLAATLYGANILPEYVQEFLVTPTVAPFVTGRFQLETAYTESQDQRLQVHIEFATDGVSAVPAGWAAAFAAVLRARSTEYARIWQEYSDRALPDLIAYRFQDPDRFPAAAIRKIS